MDKIYKKGGLYCALHQKNETLDDKVSLAVDIGGNMVYNKL